jgi:hypothetical protein
LAPHQNFPQKIFLQIFKIKDPSYNKMADNSSLSTSRFSTPDMSQIYNPKRTASIWKEHTRAPYEDESQSYWSTRDKREISLHYCKHCKPSKSQFAVKVLKNFRDHLRTKHQIDAETTSRRVDEKVEAKTTFLDQVFGTFDLKKI